MPGTARQRGLGDPGRRPDWRIVDTAGIRRRARIDPLGPTTLQAIRTIERCHIVLLMIDGEGVTSGKLGALIADRGRGCILLVNKWDKVREDPERNVLVRKLESRCPPRLGPSCTSPRSPASCRRILDLAGEIFEQFNQRVPTAKLNR